jgi:adenylate cyclase
MSERQLARIRRQLALIGLLTNTFSAGTVTGFMLYLGPTTLTSEQLSELQRITIPVVIVWTMSALAVAAWLIWRRGFDPILRWAAQDRPTTPVERDRVLRYPRRWATHAFVVWLSGAVVVAAASATVSRSVIAPSIVSTILAGAMSCSLQYLRVERTMRPITARALANSRPPESTTPGVSARLTALWALATAVPLLGIAIFGALDVAGIGYDPDRVIRAALFLPVIGLVVGFVATRIAARSVADPLSSLRLAQDRIHDGDLEARVDVDDGSEVGLLQAGFNYTAEGLVERQRLGEAFGAYVDPQLIERVLREGIDLAGEEVGASLLFTDVRGFTTFSERADAHDVVAGLNKLYAIIVPIVLRHGGHASKFIGDGLLAVFGAPDRLTDHARCAVAAGLEIVETVTRGDGGDLRVGVGINSGTVIAGTIGGGGRVDFTVIGDAVNTAARVEAATRDTGDDLLITGSTLKLLGDDGSWMERAPASLKGKSQVVRLFAPAITRRC